MLLTLSSEVEVDLKYFLVKKSSDPKLKVVSWPGIRFVVLVSTVVKLGICPSWCVKSPFIIKSPDKFKVGISTLLRNLIWLPVPKLLRSNWDESVCILFPPVSYTHLRAHET